MISTGRQGTSHPQRLTITATNLLTHPDQGPLIEAFLQRTRAALLTALHAPNARAAATAHAIIATTEAVRAKTALDKLEKPHVAALRA